MAINWALLLSVIRALVLLAVLALGLAHALAQVGPRQSAIVADVDGPIGPAVARHVSNAVDLAGNRAAEVLVLRINTPGGLATSMREIITEILASPVPVACFVAPAGSHAASAGLFVLYSCHLAAMAPGTNTGSATPVQIGVLPLPTTRPTPNETESGTAPTSEAESASGGQTDKETGTPMPSDAASAKAVNDAVAYIRSLAQLRGRNAEWAEQAVREAASISASEALDAGVINLIATDVSDLLDELDGLQVTAAGVERTLATKDLVVERIEPSVVTNILKLISDPNIALLLIVVGVYGLIFEFSNPGVGPGIIGAICLVLGLYALNQLPVNYAGLGLMLLGIGLMVAEAVTPSFGVLGVGGLIAFGIGAAILIDTDVPEFQISWTTIAATTALSFAVLSLLFGYVWRTFRSPVRTGAAGLRGASVEVLDWANGSGHVWTEGERWEAVGPSTLKPGDRGHVVALKGIKLEITDAGEDDMHDKGDS